MIHKIAGEMCKEITKGFANKFFSVLFDTTTKRNRAVLGIDIRTINSGEVITRSIGIQRIIAIIKIDSLARKALEDIIVCSSQGGNY